MLGGATVLADNAPAFSFFGWQDAGGIDYVEIQGGTWDWSPSVDDVQWGTTNAVSAAPEPASIVLMATGMLSLVGVQLRRRTKLTACVLDQLRVSDVFTPEPASMAPSPETIG